MRSSARLLALPALVCAILGSLVLLAVPLPMHAAPTAIPNFSHIFAIIFENKEASQVIGNASAPYFNRLAQQYGQATNLTATSHPSLPNYIALTGGDTFGISSNCTTCFINTPNIADQVEAAGKSWKAYMESMPSPCFVGDSGGIYRQKHNPFIYYDAIRTNAARCNRIVPFTQFATDLHANSVPNYTWITPNMCNSAHDCGIATADAWLATWVPQILASPAWQQNGVLFITFDEGSSNTGGGGTVATLVISPLGKPAFQSNIAYTHYSLLRTVEDAWGMPPLGHAASASPMADFFATNGLEPTLPPPPTAPPTQRPTRTPTPGTGPTPIPSPTPPGAATCLAAPIRTVQASGDDGNVPANVLDHDLNTRWSNQGVGSWIVVDLGSAQTVCGAEIAWYQGDTRVTHFVLQGSTDGTNFVTLLSDDSSGTTTASEFYTFTPTTARYVRMVVNGNTRNDWASIADLRVSVSGGAPAPTAIPAPTVLPTQLPSASNGIWISRAELAKLPMSGAAWERLKSAADSNPGTANIADQNSQHDTNTLAAALVYARTGDARYRSKAANAIMAAIGTEHRGRTLALGRNLVSYVIAADLINLQRYDAGKDRQFRAWLAAVRTETLDGKTLISTHAMRPNNWGTHAGASRVATDMYLGDTTDLAKAAQVFAGWLGDRSAYAGFTYGDLAWQVDPSKPVGINPKGATKNGHSIDGVLPDDQRRAGGFSWPAPKENYVWEALQGAVVQAELLSRAGYDAWNWSDKALWRAFAWEYSVNGFPAQGDDTWQIYLINHAYGASFPIMGGSTGKNMDYTDWMFGR